MMNRIITLLMSLCLCVGMMAQDMEAMGKLKKFFSSIAAYDKNYTQEKVYLHLDNNAYFPGEKIWFKAYVFKASTLLPTDMSKVLYVELVTPDGGVMERKTLPIYNGRTYGNFNLEDNHIMGYYEVRAYTRAMTNWDASHYGYSRVIPIFDEPKDTINFSNPVISQLDDKLVPFMRRKMPEALVGKEAQKERKTIMTFYPEGGHIVKGVSNRVAFKLTDDAGIPQDKTISVKAADGQELLTAKPIHDGMGRFVLPAECTEGCYAVVKDDDGESRFNLPNPVEQGCTMSVTMEERGMCIQVMPNSSFPKRMLGVSVTCRGVPCYFDTLNIATGAVEKVVPRKQLRDGIEQITLFSPEGEVLNECMTWVEPLGKPLCMEMKQNEKTYSPFSPIVLDFTLKDDSGNPLQGDFSLSVQDSKGVLMDDGASLKTDMLLCSDLKGYIHRPEYYFESNDAEHREALDLLLKVQGWKRYEWKEMAGVVPFQLKQPMEDRQIIDGKVIDKSSKQRSLPGLNVNLMLINGERHFCFASAKTDSMGKFAFVLDKPLEENVYAYLSATSSEDKKNDKRQSCYILLNRAFRPSPRCFEPRELLISKTENVRKRITERDSNVVTFEWKDTLPQIHHLPEAKVKDKKQRRASDIGTRFSYMGGENFAHRYSSVYFNAQDELQNFVDKEGYEPTYQEFLVSVCDRVHTELDVDTETGEYNLLEDQDRKNTELEMFYNNRKMATIIDNGANWTTTPNLSDYKSIYITADNQAYYNLKREQLDPDQLLVMLYSNYYKSDFLNLSKKGTRVTLLDGYSSVEDFYSPDYRKSDSPSPADRRRTLYWNPTMITDKDGKANVILFNNFRNGTQLHVNVQGIAVNGKMFELEK